ncbi:MAG: hypothetical protein VB144_13785, partial [Clostridia bacterium]|nr:hypothetical protein [Clostridia bacterium]
HDRRFNVDFIDIDLHTPGFKGLKRSRVNAGIAGIASVYDFGSLEQMNRPSLASQRARLSELTPMSHMRLCPIFSTLTAQG